MCVCVLQAAAEAKQPCVFQLWSAGFRTTNAIFLRLSPVRRSREACCCLAGQPDPVRAEL